MTRLADRQFKIVQGDSNSPLTCRQVRRYGRVEIVALRQKPFIGAVGPQAHRASARPFDCASLHGLPVNSVERSNQQSGKNRLADARIRSRNEKSVHRERGIAWAAETSLRIRINACPNSARMS